MSRAERNVSDFLSNKKIKWKFEKPLTIIDDGNRSRTWYPDFYLPDIGLYVEVCGAQRDYDYSRRKQIYKKNNIPIIFIETYKGDEKWQYFLKRSIIEFVEKKQQKWTELNLLKKDKNHITKEDKTVGDTQSIDKKWEEVVNEMRSIQHSKSMFDKIEKDVVKKPIKRDNENISIDRNKHYPSEIITNSSDIKIKKELINEKHRNIIIVWIVVSIVIAYTSIFHINDFVFGLLPLIFYLIFTIIIVLSVIIPAYEKKRWTDENE